MTKAEKTKQFIIEKSSPVFNVKGIAGTAMSDIMEVTKLAKGSLYLHFESKEELSYAVVDHNLKIVIDKTIAAAEKHESAKLKLFAFIDVLCDPLNPPLIGGCPIINFGMEADDTNPVIRKKVSNAIEGVQQRIITIVEKGVESGEFKRSWDPKIFALKAFALMEGAVLIFRISGNTDKMKLIVRIIKDEIEEQMN